MSIKNFSWVVTMNTESGKITHSAKLYHKVFQTEALIRALAGDFV